MRKKLEKTCESHVVLYAWNAFGAEGIKMNTQGRNHLPDRLFVFSRGRVLWIEFKREGEEPTSAQWQEIRRLRGLGHLVAVCDNKEDGKACVTWLGGPLVMPDGTAERATRCFSRDHTPESCTTKDCLTCAADRAKALGTAPISTLSRAVRTKGR